VLRAADEPAADSSDAPSLDEVAAAFPKLEIQRLIGHGGMGFVYQARQPELDRTVALKILSPALRRDPAFEERFAREARVLGKLQHPNIVTLFEHGESGGYFYLMMEYIDGVNLRQAMNAGRFTPAQALAVVPAICDALQSAHAEGVWHRDIKPENILLDRDGRVKIADFGIARIVGDPQRNFTLTRTGGMLGSAAYMAPEQHEKPHDVDHRADIYSLGVVIYEMLTGELPLGRFPAPSQRAAVNSRIDDIVMRTLEKERKLRQQSAEEVKTDVEGMGRLQPPTPQSARKRKGAPAILIGCGVMLLLGFLAIPVLAAIWYYSLRTEAQRVAVEQRMEARARAEDANVHGRPPDERAKEQTASDKSQPILEAIDPMDEQSRNTPAAAIKALLKAARERNARVFQNGFSKPFKASLREHGEDLEDFGDFGNCTFISANILDDTSAEVVVEANDGSKRRFTFPMILEDSEWKLNGVGSKL
jgi:serine/threonine protein kinase